MKTAVESFQLLMFINGPPGRDIKAFSVVEFAPYIERARDEHRQFLLGQIRIIDDLIS